MEVQSLKSSSCMHVRGGPYGTPEVLVLLLRISPVEILEARHSVN